MRAHFFFIDFVMLIRVPVHVGSLYHNT